MRQYDARETHGLLPYAELAEAIGAVLRAAGRGEAVAPPRLHLPLAAGGTLLVMPAADARVAMTKLVTVHPENPAAGRALLAGEVVVMDAATGERLGILDGAALTQRRTAALSLLAARVLAPAPDGALLVVGSGAQARAHVEAFAAGLGTRRVFVASRTRSGAEALAAHARGLGLEARAVAGPGEVLGECPLIVTATTSPSPVLSEDGAARVREDCFIAAVGAFKAAMAEVSPALVRRCRVWVDDVDGAAAEAGDLLQAGLDPARDCAPLADALDAPRPARGPVLFKSVGHALFDLAASRLALGGD